MAEASELTDYIENVTRCSICLEELNDPKSLPCLHTFCLKCLESYCGDKQPEDDVQCPVCRTVFQIPEHGLATLQRNFFLDQLRELKKVSREMTESVFCEACAEELAETKSEIPPATTYCVDCRQRLCERCSMPHRRIRTAAHRVVPLSRDLRAEVMASRGAAWCSRHAEEREKLYCFDCVENICLMCFAVQHQQHKCQEIDTAAESFKSRLAADTNKISDQISVVRQLLSKTEVMREAFLNEVENLHADIQKRGEYIKQIVDSCIKAVLQKLELLKTDTEKIIACDEDKLQLSLAALESFNAYSLELQNKGKPEDVSRSASDLFRRAKELLQDSAQMSANRTPLITLTAPDCEIEDSVAKYVGSLTSDRMTGAIF